MTGVQTCALPILFRCAVAEMPSVGNSAAAATSLRARACFNAACAVLMLVLVFKACTTRVWSKGSLKRNHHCDKGETSVAAEIWVEDHLAGTSTELFGVGCGGINEQEDSVNKRSAATHQEAFARNRGA